MQIEDTVQGEIAASTDATGPDDIDRNPLPQLPLPSGDTSRSKPYSVTLFEGSPQYKQRKRKEKTRNVKKVNLSKLAAGASVPIADAVGSDVEDEARPAIEGKPNIEEQPLAPEEIQIAQDAPLHDRDGSMPPPNSAPMVPIGSRTSVGPSAPSRPMPMTTPDGM